MKMTKEEKEALKQSIQHWKIDIVKRLENGDSISGTALSWRWRSDREIVNSGSIFCALCQLAGRACNNCIYIKFHGDSCCGSDRAAWSKFFKNPCLETAKAMLNKLKAIK